MQGKRKSTKKRYLLAYKNAMLSYYRVMQPIRGMTLISNEAGDRNAITDVFLDYHIALIVTLKPNFPMKIVFVF